ncbi:hypothetical protein [Paenibacillus sp. MMO-177]|uniref:hypothetical protein n=1 Tax=Paenibacillus sp. MMO-177 TaxID=3081289 RepID=UPI003019682A
MIPLYRLPPGSNMSGIAEKLYNLAVWLLNRLGRWRAWTLRKRHAPSIAVVP